jgi:hypothetical protein
MVPLEYIWSHRSFTRSVLLLFGSMEEEFASYKLGVSWIQFGDQDRSDLDDLLATKNIHGEARTKLVSLWKRHPDRQQGKTSIICSSCSPCVLSFPVCYHIVFSLVVNLVSHSSFVVL